MTNEKVLEAQAAEILSVFQSSLVTQELEKWFALFTEDAVFEFPYAPAGYTQKLVGIDEIRDYLYELIKQMEIHSFSTPELIVSKNKIVAEFTCDAVIKPTEKRYRQTYVSVIHIRDGKISRYMDYWNPIVLIEAIQE